MSRTISSSNETIAERRQALLLKKALCTCPAPNLNNPTSSTESLTRMKCVHIHEPTPPLRNGHCLSIDDNRYIITTHQKPLHIFSIIPFRKRTSSAISRSNVKLDVRGSGGRRRQTSTSRPMSSTAENQPFDPFNLLGIERRMDGQAEVSYGHLLVPSKSSGSGSKAAVRIKFS